MMRFRPTTPRRARTQRKRVRPPATVAPFNIPEKIVAEGPVLQRHHVNGRNIVAAEQPVSRRHLVVVELAIADRALHRADIRILSSRTLDRTHANVPETAVVNVDVL